MEDLTLEIDDLSISISATDRGSGDVRQLAYAESTPTPDGRHVEITAGDIQWSGCVAESHLRLLGLAIQALVSR
jgi:hypothetical protein